MLGSCAISEVSAIVSFSRRGVKSYVNIVTVTNFDASSLVHAVKAAVPQRTDRMWLYLPGCASDRTQSVLAQNPFRATPDFDGSLFKTACDVLFGQPDESAETPEDALKRKMETMMFGDEDLLVVSDGRRMATQQKIKKLAIAAVKDLPNFNRKVGWPLRLLHSNVEFADRQFAAPRKRYFNTSMPDPLETLVMFHSMKYKITRRPRSFLDLPGDNTCRGMSGVPIKTEFMHNIMISEETKKEVLRGLAVIKGGDDECECPVVDDSGKIETDDVAEGGGDGDTNIECPVPLFAWEPNEKLFRELYNMFVKRAKNGPATFSGDVVDFHPGSSAEKGCQ